MIVHFGVAASQADYARAVQFRDVRPSILRPVATMQLPAEFAPDDRVPVMILRSGPQIDLLKWSIPAQRTGAPRPFLFAGENYAYRGLVAVSYFDAEFDDGNGPVLARFTAANGGFLLLAATWKPGKYGFDQCFALLLQHAGAGMPSGCLYQPVLIDANDAQLFLDARKSRLPLAGTVAPPLTYKVLGRLSGFTFSPEDPLGIQGDPWFVFEKGQMPFAMPPAPRAAD